jgi:hypothetical protein
LVVNAAASEPEEGSESEYAPNHSPVASFSSTSFFCASDPKVFVANAHRVCTETPTASAMYAAASSSITRR